MLKAGLWPDWASGCCGESQIVCRREVLPERKTFSKQEGGELQDGRHLFHIVSVVKKRRHGTWILMRYIIGQTITIVIR